MLPRTIHRQTPLIQNGLLDVTIIYPKIDPLYFQLAQELAETLNSLATNQAFLVADCDIIVSRSHPLPEKYREHPLILLGNLNTNRAVLPLYASYYCFDDALYPGGEGYDLRTMINPYGKGGNVIMAGGSSLAGVSRAVKRLITHISAAGQRGELNLPFLLEVDLDPSLRKRLYAWPDAPLDVPLPGDHHELFGLSGSYGIMYALTGDRRFGERGADCIRAVNDQMTDSYGDRHYFAERVVRTLPWLEAGGFLSDSEILRTDQLLMGMALASQDAWWRMKSAAPPLGHRHHGKGTHEFYLIARYLREQASPEPEMAKLCELWMKECAAFLDGLGQAGLDDQDDQSSLNNMSTVFWFSLSEEHYDFFESGLARAWAQRVIALHDNMGAAAGPGGYDESLLGMPYHHHEAATPVAASTFYYQDGRFKWVLEHLPHLDLPLRGGFWAFCPIFLHKFDTGPELEPQEPEGMTGLKVLPATRYQVELNNNPPIHFEYSGHMVNAPENWLTAEGIGENHLAPEKAFDKVVLRQDFRWEDPYLILQGYQGGFRWQGHMNAANCIIRFSQSGHIFLVQNTRAHSQYFKNGVLVSDGFNNSPVPPMAECLAADDFAPIGISVTRLNEYHNTTWTRHLFWAKSEGDYFVVIDQVTPLKDGEYAAVCTWRSPLFASTEGRTWHADQGDHRFTLKSGEYLEVDCSEERDLGAVNPYVLHQFKGARCKQGEPLDFQNIFYVRPIGSNDEVDIRRLSSEQAVILRNGQHHAWVGTAPENKTLNALGFEMKTLNAWIMPENIALAGATYLDMPGTMSLQISSSCPLGLQLDLAASRLVARIDGPVCKQAALKTNIDGRIQVTTLVSQSQIEIELPRVLCDYWRGEIARRIEAIPLADPGFIKTQQPTRGLWRQVWTFKDADPVAERVRDLTVKTSPSLTNGIAEELIDTVTLEVREIWQLWPKAPEYTINLTFPEQKAIESLNLIGDSRDEPIFRTFNPLPVGIRVDISNDGFEQDIRPAIVMPLSHEISLKRFRGNLDRLEARRVLINQVCRQVRITIPSPGEDRPLVFQEIEVYGAGRVKPAITHLLSADLNGDGQVKVLAANESNALIVLNGDGSQYWKYKFHEKINHLSCHDLENNGRLFVCAGLLGGDLVILTPEGEIWKHLELGKKVSLLKDTFAGLLHTVNSVCIWQRDGRGRAALVVGGYAMLVFLDPEGEIIGHSWFDGPWLFNILRVPEGEPGEGDLWVRSGWNHGVGHYEGKPGFEPSGESLTFGGVRQPMFRALRRLVPFVNGRTAGFNWFTGNQDLGRVIVAAAEDGVGVLSARIQDFVWKVEGGTTLTACLAYHHEGGDEVVVGGVDGFIAAYDLVDGHPLRRWRSGAPVVGLAQVGKGDGDYLAVVTEKGVWALDHDWNSQGFYPLAAARMCLVGENGIAVACKDGSLIRLIL